MIGRKERGRSAWRRRSSEHSKEDKWKGKRVSRWVSERWTRNVNEEEKVKDGRQFNSDGSVISRRARLRDRIRSCVCVRVNDPTRLNGNAKWRTLVSRCVWRRVYDYTGYDVWSSDEGSSSFSSSTSVSSTRRHVAARSRLFSHVHRSYTRARRTHVPSLMIRAARCPCFEQCSDN